MKTVIIIGASACFLFGSAMSRTVSPTQSQVSPLHTAPAHRLSDAEFAKALSDATPDQIAGWRAMARSSDYIIPRAPI